MLESIHPQALPAVIAAIFGLIGVIVGATLTAFLQWKLLGRRIDADGDLAERKFRFDCQLAERKFSLDTRLADRKRRQDLAEEILAGFYEFRQMMRAIRSPMTFAGEGGSRIRASYEVDDVKKTKDSYFAIIERFERRSESFSQLMSREYRARAWFGSAIAEPFSKANSTLHKVLLSARMLVDHVGEDRADEMRRLKSEWQENIWWGAADPDRIESAINEAISGVEAICMPVLSETE